MEKRWKEHGLSWAVDYGTFFLRRGTPVCCGIHTPGRHSLRYRSVNTVLLVSFRMFSQLKLVSHSSQLNERNWLVTEIREANVK